MSAAVKPLPSAQHLTDEQRRGGACAYCRLPVLTGRAVDLGRHHDADRVRLFPRAHPDCAPGGAT